jgi:hypothetical protein
MALGGVTSMPNRSVGGGSRLGLPSLSDLSGLAGAIRGGASSGKVTVSQSLASEQVSAVNPNIVVNVLGETSDLATRGDPVGGGAAPASGAYGYDIPSQPPALFGTPGRASLDIPYPATGAGAAAVAGEGGFLSGILSNPLMLAALAAGAFLLLNPKKGKR